MCLADRHESHPQDDEFEQVFRDVGKGSDEITFEPYISYVRSIEEDQTTPEQLLGAFKAVAGDKNSISKEDLVRAGIKEATAARMIASMPVAGDGSDYGAFLGRAFSPI